MRFKYILPLIAAVITAFAADASDVAPACDAPRADTLLRAESARSIVISYTTATTSVTINNINDSADNFYFESGKPKKSGASTQTHINCSDITDITVIEGATELKVSFTTCTGKKEDYSLAFADPENRSVSSYIGSRGSDFGFTISKSGHVTWECVSQGLGFGWVSPVRERPEMGTSMWRSNEFAWLVAIGVQMRWRSHHALTLGFGFDWQNYMIKGGHYFHKNPDGRLSVEKYDEGMTHGRSRIEIFSLEMPLLYTLSFGHKNRVYAKTGPVLNFNTGGNIKTEYEYVGREYTVKTGDIGQRPVTVDALFAIGYRAIGVYVRYAPMSKMRTDAGLDFGVLSTGIVFGF